MVETYAGATGNRIGVLDGGTYYHARTIGTDPFHHFLDEVIPAVELGRRGLAHLDVLVVPDRFHPGLLRRHRDWVLSVPESGGNLVVLGETEVHTWLPGAAWTYTPTNFWWWLTPGVSLGLEISAPEHPLFEYLRLADATWHLHGVLHPPEGAVNLIDVPAYGGSILYDDPVSWPGRAIVSTLDPFYHHGSYFMPATTRFLHGFLPWLRTLRRAPAPGIGTPKPERRQYAGPPCHAMRVREAGEQVLDEPLHRSGQPFPADSGFARLRPPARGAPAEGSVTDPGAEAARVARPSHWPGGCRIVGA